MGGGFLRRFLDAQRPGASRFFGQCVRDTRETVSFCLNAEEPNASVLDIGPNNNGLAPRSVRVFEDSEIVSLFPPQQDHRERASSNTILGGVSILDPLVAPLLGGSQTGRQTLF